MSKERLEEIKEQVKYLQGDLMRDDLGWLIEQAERVQELEEENDKIAIKNLNYFKDIETLTWKNKRYRDLLEKIKEMTRYDDCRESEIYELVTNELEES